MLIDAVRLGDYVRDIFRREGCAEDEADRIDPVRGQHQPTLLDSLASLSPRGIACMTGILGGEWVLNRLEPLVDIPTGVKLTSYSGGSEDITALNRWRSNQATGVVLLLDAASWAVGVDGTEVADPRRQPPLRPPLFSSRRRAPISTPRSTPLTMS